MKNQRLFSGLLGLWLVGLAPAFAQTGKFTIGLDYGAAMIQRAQPFFFSPFSSSPLLPSDAVIPKNVRGHVDFNVSSSFALRLSVGYGMARHKSSFTGKSEPAGSAQLHSEATVTASGVPLEGVMLFQLPLNDTQRFAVHFGVGGGFYSYKLKTEGFDEITGSSVPSENRRINFSIPEVKLSGPAQFFLLGFDLRLNAKLRATFELSKLGFSGLKAKQEATNELNFPGGPNLVITEKQQDNYNAGSGFNDIGLSFGMSLSLGK
jgi:hypothetical protein